MFPQPVRLLPSSSAAAIACCLFLHLAQDAPAATRTWDGGGTNNNWTTATNWVGDVAPIAGDDLVFPDGAARLSTFNNFPASTPFNSIAFSGTAYTLNGATLLLAGGISATHTSGVNRVGLPIQLSANQTFGNSTNGSLYFTGTTIDLNGHNLTFEGVAGEIQVNLAAIVGVGDVIKTGAGYLGMVPASSYTGATEVREGRLVVQSGSALGAPGSGTTVFPGAILNPGGTFTSAEPLVLHGALNIGGFQFGTNTWTGPIALMATNASILVNSSARADLNGVISGTGGFTKSGVGTLILNADNTYAGTTTNILGTLVINGNQPNNPIVLAGGTLAGVGTVGTITASGSAAKTIGPGISPGILNCSNLTLSASATFLVELNGTAAGANYDQLNVSGTVALNDARLSVTLGYLASGGDSYTLIINDGTDSVVGAFNGMPEGAPVAFGVNLFRITYMGGTGNDVVLTKLSQARIWDGEGTDAFWLNPTNWVGNFPPASGDDLAFPPGVARLISSNNYPANTAFNRITLGGINYELYGSNIILNAGLTSTNASQANFVNLPIQLGADQTFTVVSGTPGTQVYLSGGLNLAGRALTLAGAGSWQISSTISGSGSLTKLGSGVALLYASNTFSGPVQILGGRINIYHNNALGLTGADTTVASGASLALASVTSVPEPLVLAGSLVSGGAGPRTLSGPITLSGNVQFDVSAPLAIDSVISGSGGFHKFSPGTLTLNANNTYSGATTVSDGTLLVNGVQPASMVLLNGGTLGGTGTVGTVTSGGAVPKFLRPGGDVGILNSGSVSLNPSTTLLLVIRGTNAGISHDQLNVTGSVNLGGSVLSYDFTFAPNAGDAFTLINNDGADAVIGTFAGLPQGTTFTNAGVFRISYTGGDGNDVVLTRVSPPSQLASIMTITNGHAAFQGMGLSNLTYTIEASTNLINWINIGTAPADTGGLFNFTDTNAPAYPRRFYRAISP